MKPRWLYRLAMDKPYRRRTWSELTWRGRYARVLFGAATFASQFGLFSVADRFASAALKDQNWFK